MVSEYQKKMITWNIGTEHEQNVICDDERTFMALCGLLEKDNLTFIARNVYTIEEQEE